MESKQQKISLGSITDEAAACRKAFANIKTGAWVMHCHHEDLFERLTEPAENRIAYILASKSAHEQALRLHLFRPIPRTIEKTFVALDADYNAKRAPLYADYKAKRGPLYADYAAKVATLDADYKAKRDLLDADYEAKRDSLYADYEAKRDSLYADYEAKRASLHAKSCIAGCPWNGKTIFPRG